MYEDQIKKEPKEKKEIPFIVKAAISFVVLLFLSVFIAVAIKKSVEHEATKAKTEVVDKVKAVKINDSTIDNAALITAKTIHKIKSFKNRVKNDLKNLDSADTAKESK